MQRGTRPPGYIFSIPPSTSGLQWVGMGRRWRAGIEVDAGGPTSRIGVDGPCFRTNPQHAGICRRPPRGMPEAQWSFGTEASLSQGDSLTTRVPTATAVLKDRDFPSRDEAHSWHTHAHVPCLRTVCPVRSGSYRDAVDETGSTTRRCVRLDWREYAEKTTWNPSSASCSSKRGIPAAWYKVPRNGACWPPIQPAYPLAYGALGPRPQGVGAGVELQPIGQYWWLSLAQPLTFCNSTIPSSTSFPGGLAFPLI